MQIPILSGIYMDDTPDYRTSYPRNLIPVPKAQGISNGYLKPAHGIDVFATGPGVGRGGINWNGVCYRVMGSKLVSVSASGIVTTIGDVGSDGKKVSLDYSFDHLAIVSEGKLFLYDGTTLAQNVDPDLGAVKDAIWLDGYFVTTDGEFIVVTELTDPFAVNPLKYGSSEIDPDPVLAVKEIRNEIAAVNRYTIEFFDNVGGASNQFPFRRIDGAQIMRGAVGTHAVTVFAESLAFVGSKKDESIAVWMGRNGNSVKISTREVDQRLKAYNESILAQVEIETRMDDGHENLYIHLPTETLVYDVRATQAMKQPVWYTLDSGLETPEKYRARHYVRVYDGWICDDPKSSNIGKLNEKISTHYGSEIGWSFSTMIIYNEYNGYIVHEISMTGLTGRVALGDDPRISTSYSVDGVNWSQRKYKKAGKIGDRTKNIQWLKCGHTQKTRIQKFEGTSAAHIGVARIDMRIEGLAW